MFRMIFTAFILVIYSSVFCQGKEQNIDELKSIITGRNVADTNKIKALIQSGVYYMHQPAANVNATDSAFYYFSEAQKIAGNLNLMKWQNDAFMNMGNWYLRQGKLKEGREFYLKIIGYHEANRNIENQAATWNALGLAIPQNDSMSTAEKIKSFEQSRLLYRQSKKMIEEAGELSNIALAHTQSGELDKAESELLQALEMYKLSKQPNLKRIYDRIVENSKLKGDLNKELSYNLELIKNMQAIGDTSNIDDYYFKLATTYIDLGLYSKSMEWAEIVMAIDKNRLQYDDVYMVTAMIVYDLIKLDKPELALESLQNTVNFKQPDGFVQQIMVNESMGDCYAALKKYEIAESYYLKMVGIFEQNTRLKDQGKLNPSYVGGAIHHYKTIANFYLNFNKYVKAQFYLTKIFLLPSKLIKPVTLAKLHFMQFKIDSANGNLKSAIENYQMFKQLNDSVFNETRSKQIVELQVKYETEKKESDMQLLISKEQLQSGALKKSVQARNLTYALAAGLVMLIVVGYSRYRLKIKNNQQLQQQQQEINHQNEKLTDHIKLQQKLMNEKEWLMKEIHHRVKNNLQIVMSLLNSQSIYLKDTVALGAIKESQHRVHAISLIHKKLYQSENLSVVDMKAYIAEVADYLADNLDADHHIRFTVTIAPIQLDVAQAVPLGLIINESVTNAVKYAFAGKTNGSVEIKMAYTAGNSIELKICDNGIGLPENFDWHHTQSLGMNLMQGLCKQLDGCFDIINNNGLTISVSFKPAKPIEPGLG